MYLAKKKKTCGKGTGALFLNKWLCFQWSQLVGDGVLMNLELPITAWMIPLREEVEVCVKKAV